MFWRGNKELKKAHNKLPKPKSHVKKETTFYEKSDGDDIEDYFYDQFPKDFKILLAKIEDMHSDMIKELKEEIKILKAERAKQDDRLWEVINKLIDKPVAPLAKTALEVYAEKKNASGGYAEVDKAAVKK